MSLITSGHLPILVLLLLLAYWLRRARAERSRHTVSTEAEALRRIQRTLPPVWADRWAERATPGTLVLHLFSLKKPYVYFQLGPDDLLDHAPGLSGLTPLVERNGEAIVGWLPDGRFVQLYYEDGSKGDAAITVLGRNYQEFALSLLLELEDAGMRDRLQDFAAALQFGYLDDLIDILERDGSDDARAALGNRIADNG